MRVALFGSVFLVACGTDGLGDDQQQQGGASATLAFSNATPDLTQARADVSSPTEFGVKLIAVYIAEAIDPETGNNLDADGDGGGTSCVYVNPACEEDLMHCDVSGGTAEDGAEIDKVIDDYFDFAAPTAEVNAALNAQERSVYAETYNWARMEFCKSNAEAGPTVLWAGSDGVENEWNRCGYATVAIDPPLEVAEGDAITVELAYDLTTTLVEGDEANGETCTGEGDARSCFSLPEFVPSATVE